MADLAGFEFSAGPQPRRARTQTILLEHPRVRQLIGKNRYSFLIIVGLVAGQFALAWGLRSTPWWAVLAVAYLVGAFLDHGLFVMIHECAHNLIFRGRLANMF